MKIKELYELVGGLPKYINVIAEDGSHPYIGLYEKAPDEIKSLKVKKAQIDLTPWTILEQVIFYI